MTWLVVHAAATWALCGLIWQVQLVHYPLFALVGERAFPAYQAAHVARITPLVATLMGVELVTAAVLALDPPAGVDPALLWVGAALVAALWAATGLVQVPCHARLERAFDPATHRRLIRTNWLRTALWTVRGCLVAAALLAAAAAD